MQWVEWRGIRWAALERLSLEIIMSKWNKYPKDFAPGAESGVKAEVDKSITGWIIGGVLVIGGLILTSVIGNLGRKV